MFFCYLLECLVARHLFELFRLGQFVSLLKVILYFYIRKFVSGAGGDIISLRDPREKSRKKPSQFIDKALAVVTKYVPL